MANLLRCESCNGHKNIISLGNILKACTKCNGLGFIEQKEKANEETEQIIKKKPTKKKTKRENVLHCETIY